jgi:squalene-associated FAD-dependent desaturase
MNASGDDRPAPRVAVVGGGLAGLAATAALREEGLRVELFEARRRLGGRAGSFRDLPSGQLIDHCQHVAMACCTNLADFCRRTGVAQCFRRGRRLHFIGPDGARYDLSAAPLVPAPVHLVPALMRLGYLSLTDRLRILRTMSRLARLPAARDDQGATIGSWLRRQRESDRALERFWSPVLVGALSETLDRAAVAAAQKVLVDGFLASRQAYELEIPRGPLGEIFDGQVAEWLDKRAVAVHRGARVTGIEGDARRAETLVLPDGSRQRFDFFVVAVPWRGVRALFAPAMLEALPGLEGVGRIEPAAITAVHLWFDRPITRLPHAVLVGRLSQWLFNHGRRDAGAASSHPGYSGSHPGYHYQVVISASHALVDCDQGDLVARVQQELGAIWPQAREAELLRWRVVTNAEAVFSARPGVERLRPAQATPIPNLALAGDWTATGWPATMEGAVRSGHLAAEAILEKACPGGNRRLLAADLPRGRLARRLLEPDPRK